MERTHPLATTPWHDADPDTTVCVHTFLPPNTQGKSAKDLWADNHTELIAENKDNPNFITIYADGSLTKKDGKQYTGYGVAGYYLGRVVFETKGALSEQAKVFNTEMTGLSEAGKAAKHFILNGDWTHQPFHIVFYTDNSATISHIHKDTPGKAQEQSLAFRSHIKDILNEVDDTLITVSWVPGHTNITRNEKADHLTKEGAKLRPEQ